MSSELIARYDRPLPRYTSYPTAPHFHGGITAADYAGWLEGLPADAPLSLYLHIPFCDSLCWFCGCHTKVVRRYAPVAAYVALLLTEIDLVAARLGPGRQIGHLHFGGGSPTLLSADAVGCIFGRLRDHLGFTADAEIAVEIDPRDLKPETVEAFAAAGLNRASIGVQDINEEVQKAINRIQSFETTAEAVGALRAAGVTSINLDLMYGLPHQSLERVLATVDAMLTLEPDRIALFGYAHVPHMKRHQRLIPEEALPGAEERLTQAEAAAERLVAAGYQRIGLDHFARADDPMAQVHGAGELRRNFQGYTTDPTDALIGLGLSAIGSLPQGYVQNTTDIQEYRAALLDDRLPVARGLALSDDDRLRRTVIERIMCDLVVDLDDLPGAVQDFGAELADLAPLQADGLVELDGRTIRVTERGRPLVRNVAAVFDSYLGKASGAGQVRHSRAV